MSRPSPWITAALLAGWLGSAPGAPVPKQPDPVKDSVVFLGCGDVGGPGAVVQIDRTGKVLGTVQLPGTPYGLAADKAGLVAVIPSGRQGSVVRIDAAGKADTLLRDRATIPSPIAVAADPTTGDILVADNETDVLLLLPAGKAADARPVLRIEGHGGHLQDMSVAFARDGHLLFGGSGPNGVYRFRAGKDATLGEPLLPDEGAVAADPTSKRWVAARRDKLTVFEDGREEVTLAYPPGRRRWHGAMAFGPDGAPVLALHAGKTNYDIVVADLKTKTFQPLFSWDKSRIVTLTVGPKLAWKD